MPGNYPYLLSPCIKARQTLDKGIYGGKKQIKVVKCLAHCAIFRLVGNDQGKERFTTTLKIRGRASRRTRRGDKEEEDRKGGRVLRRRGFSCMLVKRSSIGRFINAQP
jgi:hypothetical protein